MKLYLCEKPSQGEDVAKFLGMSVVHKKRGYYQKDNILVTWARGHLFKLQPPEHYCPELKGKWSFDHIPVIPDKFDYTLDTKAKAQFRAIKTLLKKAKEVYIATDPDPEGECIARNVLKFSGYKKDVYRILYGATDKRTLTKAFAKPLPGWETEWMYQTALARAQSDWVVGMNLTMAMTLVVQKLESSSSFKKAFPVGRVKTPAAMLVYLKEQAIKNFKPVKYYEIEIDVFTESGEEFALLWDVPDRALEDGRLLNVEYAKKAVAYLNSQKLAVVVDLLKTKKEKQPPLPFDLTSLQSSCDRYDIGPDETLDIAQSLYDKPFSSTTYPRTNIGYLPEGLTEDISETVSQLLSIDLFSHLENKLDLSKRTKAWNDKKVKVHHGIIPTANRLDMTRLTQKQKAVFVLIANRYLAQFLPDYVYENTNVKVKAGNLTASAICNVPLSKGWRIIEADDEQKTPELPALNKNQKLAIKSVRLLEKQTKTPSRYTKASLAKAMEKIASEIDDKKLRALVNNNDGIGTVATRPAIIKDLVLSGLLVEDKRKLKPSRWFDKYMRHIPEQMKQPATSALWERGFISIKDGNLTSEQFVDFQAKFVLAAIAELKKTFMEIK